MSSVLLHRGPDYQGKYFNSKVGLAHNYLPVIDLSPAGQHPMVLEEDRLVIVFDENFLIIKS
jgi:asparagine synthase (glutamine-hydrolysing)